MTEYAYVWITIGLAFGAWFVGVLASVVVLYGKWPSASRIQPKPYKPQLLRKRMPLVVFNLVVLLILSAGGMIGLRDWFVLEGTTTVWLFAGQMAVLLLLDDAWFYLIHRTMHEVPVLMRRIHSIHHRATQPFPSEYLYVHPLEWMIGAVGPFLGVLVLGEVHIHVFWAFAVWRTFHEIDIHSGFKSPLGKLIPFYGKAEHHDLHHSKVRCNYSSMFTFWDAILGTRAADASELKRTTSNSR